MILIAGYPYIRENFLNTFREPLERGEVFFLLPKEWKAKGGQVVFRPPKRKGIFTTQAFFFHSHYPLIGGLLKGWMPLLPLALWRLRGNISVLYSPSEPTLLTTAYQGIWAKVFGLKHIIFTWENIDYRKKFSGPHLFLKELIIRLNCLLADGIVCGNSKAREIIRRYTSQPTAVIPLSGVDVEFFNPDKKDLSLREEYHLEGKVIFSFIGALGYRKGIHLILDALHGLVTSGDEAHLIIAGSGEYETSLRQKILELHLETHVTMIPWSDSAMVRKILSVTDVFLYPSLPYGGWEEQFGYSIAEAMAMEIPVISTHSGSIGDLLEDKKSGILIEPHNGPALGDAMHSLAHDEELKQRLSQAARRVIVEKYSFESIARQYQQFFSEHGFS